jgi:hypothetical protein
VADGLWAFVFSGDYGRRPHYVQVGYMTGRERRDGPPLFVCFVYVLLCIVFVRIMDPQYNCIQLSICCTDDVCLFEYLLYRESVFNWVPVAPRKCI